MSFKLALCQMTVKKDKKVNIEKAESMLCEAAAQGANVAVLPEMWNCPYTNKFFKEFAETREDGESISFLSETAKKLKMYIIGGSIPEAEGEIIYNTSFSFDTEGNIIGRHRKMHLFDIDVKGGVRFKESDTLGRGNDVTVIDTIYGRIGVMICYDIRFPELARLLALADAQLIVSPGSFNMTTGPVHWDLLIKTRAMDNQVYFAGAAPARDLDSEYKSYAHSAVASPWGEYIALADARETICYANIDTDYIDEVRRQMPLLAHRREDIYRLEKFFPEA